MGGAGGRRQAIRPHDPPRNPALSLECALNRIRIRRGTQRECLLGVQGCPARNPWGQLAALEAFVEGAGAKSAQIQRDIAVTRIAQSLVNGFALSKHLVKVFRGHLDPRHRIVVAHPSCAKPRAFKADSACSIWPRMGMVMALP